MTCDCSSMVERNLAMVEVAGSIPVSRSVIILFFLFNCSVYFGSNYFKSLKVRIYRHVKKQSYVNNIYKLILTFLRSYRSVEKYVDYPKSIARDLDTIREIGSDEE